MDSRTSEQKALSAKALNDRQRHYDRLHHQMRVRWLSAPKPMYADGVVVPKHVVLNLLNSSKRTLELIDKHAVSVRSVDLNNAAYLAELDAFAAQPTQLRA